MKTAEISVENALDYVKQIAPTGKSALRIQAQNGKKMVRTKTVYISGVAADLSNNSGEMLLPSSVPDPGVTNFPKGNSLPKGVYYLVTGVRALFSVAAGKTVKTADWDAPIPTNFRNGEFSIIQNGDGTLFETPGTDLGNLHRNLALSNEDDFRAIGPFLLRPEAEISLKQKLATGDPTNQLYRYEFRVLELIDENNA